MARKFGVEIEIAGGTLNSRDAERVLNENGIKCNVERYSHTHNKNWKVVSDGSLHGANACEVVSPPLRGQSGVREVRNVARILSENGASANRSCGLHVHVSAAGMSDEAFKNLAKLIAIHEHHFKRVLPTSRQNSHWSKWPTQMAAFHNMNIDAICARIDQCANVSELRALWHNDRYHAVNFEALSRHGTVEFRMHGGTVDETKIAAWVALCVGLVRRANVKSTVKVRWENGRKRNWQDFIRGAGRDHNAFFLERWEQFGGNTSKVYASRTRRELQLQAA